MIHKQVGLTSGVLEMSILLLCCIHVLGRRPTGNDGCGKTFGPERSRATTPPTLGHAAENQALPELEARV